MFLHGPNPGLSGDHPPQSPIYSYSRKTRLETLPPVLPEGITDLVCILHALLNN